MPPTRIVVFRFDRDPLVCRDKIQWLRLYNPGIKIFGLYGGPFGYRRAAFVSMGRRFLGLDHLYCSPHAGRWNWKNGDLALGNWFERVGRHEDFDVLHFIEWDLLMLDSLDHLYAHVPQDALGLTTVTPLSEVEAEWEWMTRKDARAEWDQLLSYARKEWAYDATPSVCLAGAASLPRSFLERYAHTYVPALCHDEIRLPLFAQAHGFPIVDTGFRSSWDDSEDRLFNLQDVGVESSAIAAECDDPSGRRVFHPVRSIWRYPGSIRSPRPTRLLASKPTKPQSDSHDTSRL